jgi:hypothetical protein
MSATFATRALHLRTLTLAHSSGAQPDPALTSKLSVISERRTPFQTIAPSILSAQTLMLSGSARRARTSTDWSSASANTWFSASAQDSPFSVGSALHFCAGVHASRSDGAQPA